MTCQNCGHPKNRHQWVLDRRDLCSEKGCDCNGYKKAHPVPAVTDLPDAETAWHEWAKRHKLGRYSNSLQCTAFLAGFAAASGPWAEQLDAANAERDKLEGQVRYWMNYGKGQTECGRELLAERAAALARNAELQRERDDWEKQAINLAGEFNDADAEATSLKSELATLRVRDEHYEVLLADNLALRAELDNLRDRVTALADECDVRQMGEKVERENAHRAKKGSTDEFFHYGKQRAWGEARNLIRTAIVRGSDDE